MRTAEQLYTAANAARVLDMGRSTFFARVRAKALPAPDVILPGGGKFAKRWSASGLSRFIDERRVDRRAIV